uniref:Uncharacterized protein n=1 Tax=Romanomermis culicivorax TaxID=13658 RepID=A0A915K8G0_ROMCU
MKTNSEEISDKQRMKEAIRLRIMETPLEHMLVDPIISESDLLMGKQVLDKIRTGEPQFVVGLVYNSTIDKVEKTCDLSVKETMDTNKWTILSTATGK